MTKRQHDELLSDMPPEFWEHVNKDSGDKECSGKPQRRPEAFDLSSYIYIGYGDHDAAQPAESSYGSQGVWDKPSKRDKRFWFVVLGVFFIMVMFIVMYFIMSPLVEFIG
jgi:hypothetical protein